MTLSEYECLKCGAWLEKSGTYCDSCAEEIEHTYRTCEICGGEFWDGGTSCDCDPDCDDENYENIDSELKDEDFDYIESELKDPNDSRNI